jgi:hypothetical protein
VCYWKLPALKYERYCESIGQTVGVTATERILRGAFEKCIRTAGGHVTRAVLDLAGVTSESPPAPQRDLGRRRQRARWPCMCPSYTPYNNVGC